MEFEFLLSTRRHLPLVTEAVAGACGFDGIELIMLWDEAPKRAQQFRKLQRVRVIHAPITDFNHARFVVSLTSALTLADRLDVAIVAAHPGARQFGGPDNVHRCNDTLKELAVSHQRIVVLEVLPAPLQPKHERQLAYDSPEAWVQAIKEQRLLACLDTTHVASWGKDPAGLVPQLGPRLAHVHVSDFRPAHHGKPAEQHLFIGDGTIAFRSFFQALQRLPAQTLAITLEPKGRYDITDQAIQQRLRESLRRLKQYAQTAPVTG